MQLWVPRTAEVDEMSKSVTRAYLLLSRATYSFLLCQPRDRSGLLPPRLNLKEEFVRREENDDSFRCDSCNVDDRVSQFIELYLFSIDTSEEYSNFDVSRMETYQFLIFPSIVSELELDSSWSSRNSESGDMILRYDMAARESRESIGW